MIRVFRTGTRLGEIADSKQGIATADNNRFLREWFEVAYERIFFNATDYIQAMYTGIKWFPYNKGGDYRKWYGNNDYIINYEKNGKELKESGKAVIRNPQFQFQRSFTWSLISSSVAAFRYKPNGHLFDVAGMSCFSEKHLYYLMAFCNSIVSTRLLKVIAPTLNYQCGDIANLPIFIEQESRVNEYVEKNIEVTKDDWDGFEISWDFKKHPLI